MANIASPRVASEGGKEKQGIRLGRMKRKGERAV
jgi:hypothetical protein